MECIDLDLNGISTLILENEVSLPVSWRVALYIYRYINDGRAIYTD